MEDPTITLEYVTSLVKDLNELCFEAVWMQHPPTAGEMTADQKTCEEFGITPFTFLVGVDGGGDLSISIHFLDLVIWQSDADDRDLIRGGEEWELLGPFLVRRAKALATLVSTYRQALETVKFNEEVLP